MKTLPTLLLLLPLVLLAARPQDDDHMLDVAGRIAASRWSTPRASWWA